MGISLRHLERSWYAFNIKYSVLSYVHVSYIEVWYFIPFVSSNYLLQLLIVCKR